MAKNTKKVAKVEADTPVVEAPVVEVKSDDVAEFTVAKVKVAGNSVKVKFVDEKYVVVHKVAGIVINKFFTEDYVHAKSAFLNIAANVLKETTASDFRA